MVGAKPEFKSHLYPSIPASLGSQTSLLSRLSLFFWQMGLMSTPAPQGCGARTEERLDSLSALLPPTQPSPLGTVRHLGGAGRQSRTPLNSKGS